MVSACVFSVALFHRDSPVADWNFWTRNMLMGLAMGITAVAIIRSPWGRRSGAHFNPAVTITFYRLNKIGSTDAIMYALSHFIGGTAGVLVSWLILGERLADASVNFVVTVPGNFGTTAAFVAEFAIAFVLMSAILAASNSTRFANYTPYIAGILLALFITVESHISGTSMNPARTFASAVVAGNWSGWWVYAAAPVFAMLAAGELHLRFRGTHTSLSKKLANSNTAGTYFRRKEQKVDVIEVTKQSNLFPTVTGLF